MTATREPRDRYIKVNGLRLHFLDWGGRRPEAVMFLHGGTGNAHDWDGLAEELSSGYRVYSLDQRGHGDSDWSREGYWPWQLASDLHEIIQKLELAPLNLIGQSMGCWTAMAYAGDHSRDLKRLILTDFGPEVGKAEGRSIRALISDRPRAFRTEEEAVAWLQQIYPTRPKSLLERRVKYGMRKNWVDRLVWKHDQEFTWITGGAGLKATPYLWDQLAKVRCPTLVVRGAKSNILPPETRDRMLAALPNATGAEVKNAWHFLYDENPAEFSGVVRGFLSS